MTRRRRRNDGGQVGIEARFWAFCHRCPDDIRPGDRITYSHGRAIHARCASGADE